MKMKTFSLLALLAAGTGAAQAQSIAAGTVSLGGGIGYSTSNRENGVGNNTYEFSRSEFRFNPSVGYFVADNLEVGLNIGVISGTQSETNNSPTRGNTFTNFQVGPYARYYKLLGDQFAVTGALGAGFQHQKHASDAPGGDIEFKANGFYADITPGIVFFPIPKLGLSASIGSIGYSRVSESNDDAPDDYKNTFSDFGARFGLNQLQFGGTYYFGR